MFARSAFRRRFARADLRVAIGAVLVLVSVAGVWLVVAEARQTSPVLSAARTIIVGEPIDAADLRVVDVVLGPADEVYAAPGSLAVGAVATRTVPTGELLPLSAVAEPGDIDVTTVVVQTAGAVPGSVSAGTRVEVWSAPQTDRGVFGDPRVLVRDATVRAIQSGEGLMAQRAAAVELAVSRADVAAVLAAVSAGDAVSVVATGPGPR
ncbi:SAF domain-containing protein [Microbacterium sp. cf332]|uniref:SAF domain-containing protein n=1 Tax=Microbacterium sp. cf332 TaxID=1761804 RepID=UPI00088EF552|nr:SAF domain-containing protein [Microbacterium sp. cf332]SDQ80547.1 hypothetical protein SAMN04487847_2560 [Microbacterium sp. cf332]